MPVGVVFISTGGGKMARALRSFRRMEPTLPVHIVFDTSCNSWMRNREEISPDWFAAQLNVKVLHIYSTGWINGSFNEAIRWMQQLGHSHACCLHDDTVFSSLPENSGDISKWLAYAESSPAVGITLSAMEALVRTGIPGIWERSPAEWDQRDLESESVWRTLLPNGESPMYFGSPGSDDGISLGDWFVKYFVPKQIEPISRLGAPGFIIPIDIWERIGGFGEHDGIFYDMEYPVQTAMLGLPPILVAPNAPFLHLHNQSTAFGDPAVGIWGHDLASFIHKYGKEPGQILQEYGYYDFKPLPTGILHSEPNLRYWLHGGKFRKGDPNAAS
jgi:hypothetical protein